VKGEKPPAPTRGLSKRSAVGAGDGDDVDDVDEDAAAGDAAAAAADLVPRTDIRFALTAVLLRSEHPLIFLTQLSM